MKRSFLGLTAAALMMAGATAATAQTSSRSLVVVATGGAFESAMKEAFYQPYTAATKQSITPVAASAGEMWAKLEAMVKSGQVEWDILSTGPDELISKRDLLHRIDCQALKNISAALPDACTEYGVLRTVGATLLAYDAGKYPPGKTPQSWADFWDVQRFPGARSLPNAGYPWVPMIAALIADGVSPDKLFPLDVDRAFRKLDQLRPYITVWWKTGDQSQRALRDGEVALAMIWSGRALALKKDGFDLGLSWNGATRDIAYWSIAKGAPSANQAVEFLDFYLARPEAHAEFARKIFYNTANSEAYNKLAPEEARLFVAHPDNYSKTVAVDFEWVAVNREILMRRWNEWISRSQ